LVGAAERALNGRHREIIERLRRAVETVPPYQSSSGFRFAYDPTAPRDIADASAVAQHLGVFIRAAVEQPLIVPPVDDLAAGGTAVEDDGGVGVEPSVRGADPDLGDTGSGVVAEVPGSAESTTVVLTAPDRSVARDKAEQGCRALDNGWWAEAEELFVSGAASTPTDALLWFGAGLAASHLDADRAAEHLERASRYLLPTDPAGATYAILLAAAHREAIDDRGGARLLLLGHAEALTSPCPTLSLHLARLGPEADRAERVTEALASDPLLEADLAALGFDRGGLVEARLVRSREEAALVEGVVAALRRVDGGPGWTDEPPSEDGHALGGDGAAPEGAAPSTTSAVEPPSDGSPDGTGTDPSADAGPATGPRLRLVGDPSAPPESHPEGELALTACEIGLWRQVEVCEEELVRAREAVEVRERARQDTDREIARLHEVARTDLNHLVAVPFFISAVAIAVAIVALFVAGRLMASRLEGLSAVITGFTWLGIMGLVALAGYQLFRAWWPHRTYPEARRALVVLPQREWEASRLRQSEFNIHRRFNRASQEAELRMRRITHRRSFLVPRRPTFDRPTFDRGSSG
jgi:hypothetical protein